MANRVITGYLKNFRPQTRLNPWQWAERHVQMQNSSRSARFATSETPWLRAPLECAADGEIIECVIVAPTGAGKSAIAEAIIPYIVAEDPGNLLYASQTDPDAGFWAETRLVPTLKQCGPLDGLWPSDRHKSRKMEIIFSHMAMVIGGANLSNFQEKSCRWLYGDEVWNWGGKDVGGGGLIREFLARHHNRWNRKIYLVSQGSRINTEFHGEWEKCHQADYSWKCQKCHTPTPSSDRTEPPMRKLPARRRGWSAFSVGRNTATRQSIAGCWRHRTRATGITDTSCAAIPAR
jgi:phage terminase large subunit GpA-like protein